MQILSKQNQFLVGFTSIPIFSFLILFHFLCILFSFYYIFRIYTN
jgi:hypothetical protein